MPNTVDQPPTRDRILGAAVVEIAERGIGGVRTRGVAERAGVNSALVHYHFGSMDDLVCEAAATVFAGLTAGATDSLTAPTVAEGFAGMSDLVADVDPDEPAWQAMLEVMVHARRHPRLRALVLGWLETNRAATEERLDRAVAEGELPDGIDTEGLSLALMALYDGLGLYGYIDPSLDVRRAGRSISGLLGRLDEGASP